MHNKLKQWLVCLKGIEHAARLGMQRITVETDAVNVISALNGIDFHRSFLGTMFREIRAKTDV